MIVIDASALHHVLLNTSRADAVAAHLDDDVFAPDLVIAETLHVLRRDERHGVDPAVAVELLATTDIEFMKVTPYVRRVWELRHNVTSYDATYVALAEDLRCPLLTCDARLARAPGLRIPVILA